MLLGTIDIEDSNVLTSFVQNNFENVSHAHVLLQTIADIRCKLLDTEYVDCLGKSMINLISTNHSLLHLTQCVGCTARFFIDLQNAFGATDHSFYTLN